MKILNRTLFKKDKEKFKIPRSVQDAIPIDAMWEDGIFLVGKNKYSKCFKFTDINYSVASREDKEEMFLEYSELLNSFDTGATSKITIINRRLNKLDFQKTMFIKLEDDELDKYRKEYNKMLLDKATASNGIVQEKCITITIEKKSIEDARLYFLRIGTELINKFKELGSVCVELEAVERLQLFHDFYRVGEETAFNFDFISNMRKGHSFKDYICPDTFEIKDDYIKIGNRYARVLFLKEYANYIKDSMVAELTDINKNSMMSIDVIPIAMDEAVREAENRRLGVETNITNWQRRQNANNNFSAIIPYDLEMQREQSKEFLDDLITRDQRMFMSVLTMVHTAETKEELDNDTEEILTIARKNLCQFGVLKFQQLDGLNTAMPFGVRKIDTLRTLTTESLAVFMPFRVQEIRETNGIYYGQNVISKNMIIADRKKLLNGNSLVFGVSGSGKSFITKEEIVFTMLKDKNADVIVIDPENEYTPLVKALGGEVIKVSATSGNHINAMDMNKNYADGANPVILKSEFILSLCEQLIGSDNLGAKQKSIIDRCTASTYRYYLQGNYQGTPPTLQDFYQELLKQEETEAKEIALAIELFVNGSLNTFAKQTNVDTENRLICYNILDLGKQLLPLGMLVVLDSILNRITQNRAKGRNTYIFIDEIYLLLRNEYSANFLYTLWKRVRKYGAYLIGITQNVEDMLQNNTARAMMANSELIIMLNQASTDRAELAKLLNISDLQLSYITNVGSGEGLLKIGSSLIPFSNKFPKDTELYKLMTTKLRRRCNYIMRKIVYTIITILLIGLVLISSYLIFKEKKQNEKQENTFEDLIEIVEENIENQEERKIDINKLYEENKDIVGWLKIDNTTINYPIMQNINDPNYYLHRDFYKNYSSYGTPYMAKQCNLNSDNIVIYGHHMKNNKMFGELEKYKSKDFYNNHKIITFTTLEKEYSYEIFAVFKTTVYTKNTFRYYENINFENKKMYNDFINICKDKSLYQTGIEIKDKEKLITLSTCEYSNKNSRLVIVARKIK
ncbi:MAG: SrtB family sortase [Clostridiales bacterium]|nr:SrtB family sortase [Clostridiales bacterium]MBD9158636.1 SrtB family sortase [Clostridiales bacterium]